MKDATKPAKRAPKAKENETFSAEEREAMREYVREKKGVKSGKTDGTADVLAKIAEMPAEDKAIAERIHAIVTSTAPGLVPRTWYGMPAYANADGKIICFLQPASKFKARYSTLGFNDAARLDEGNMWPTSFAVTKLTAADEKRLGELVKRAVEG